MATPLPCARLREDQHTVLHILSMHARRTSPRKMIVQKDDYPTLGFFAKLNRTRFTRAIWELENLSVIDSTSTGHRIIEPCNCKGSASSPGTFDFEVSRRLDSPDGERARPSEREVHRRESGYRPGIRRQGAQVPEQDNANTPPLSSVLEEIKRYKSESAQNSIERTFGRDGRANRRSGRTLWNITTQYFPYKCMNAGLIMTDFATGSGAAVLYKQVCAWKLPPVLVSAMVDEFVSHPDWCRTTSPWKVFISRREQILRMTEETLRRQERHARRADPNAAPRRYQKEWVV